MTSKALDTANQTHSGQPPQVLEELVDLKSFRYLRRYTSEMIKGLVRSHRPVLDRQFSSTGYKVKIDEALVQSWVAFVSNTAEYSATAPLTYYNCAGAFGFFNILRDLRVNFSTILHLKAELEVVVPKPLKAGDDYCLSMHVVDIIPREATCILVIQSELRDSSGELLRIHNDYWYVRKCPAELMKNIAYPGNHDGNEFIGISRKQSNFNDQDDNLKKRTIIQVPNDAGQQFAKISGDYNVIHTTNWGARLCGKKKAFLQGFGVMNLCLHHVSILLGKPVEQLDITFSKPIYVGQTAELVALEQRFELCDAQGKLLAFGNYR